MNALSIAREAYRGLLADRRLWLFGFFVGAGASGASFNASNPAAAAMPAWVLGLAAGAGLLGLVFLALHVISEAALILGVYRERSGKDVALGSVWKRGVRLAPRVFGVKLAVFALSTLVIGLAAAPAIAGALGAIELALGVALTAVLAVFAAPPLVTFYLMHEIGLRMVVLERRGVADSLGGARRFLRGRLRQGLLLLLVDGVAQAAAGVIGAPFALLAMGAGFGVYTLAGVPWGIAVGALLAMPVAALIVAARGTYRSRLWTVAFLEERPTLG